MTVEIRAEVVQRCCITVSKVKLDVVWRNENYMASGGGGVCVCVCVCGCGSRQLLVNKRHDALCEIVFHHLQQDNSASKMEVRCNAATDKRPDDIYHPDFLEG